MDLAQLGINVTYKDQQAKKALDRLEKQANKTKKASDKLAEGYQHADAKAEAYWMRVRRQQREVTKDLKALSRANKQAFDREDLRVYKKDLGATESQLRRLRGKIPTHEFNRLQREISQNRRELTSLNKTTSKTSSLFATLKTTIIGIGAFGAVESIRRITTALFEAGKRAQNLNLSLKAVFGAETQAEIKFLKRTASELGQNYYQLAESYKAVGAAAKGTALEGKELHKIFKGVIEAGTALGLTAGEVSGALRAISQMMSKGNVQAEELRGQLGERLPGAFQLMAKAMGVSTSELNNMLDRGEVLAADVLPLLAKELHKTYGAAAKTMALEGASAATNRFTQAWTGLKVALADMDAMIEGINSTTSAIQGLTTALERIEKNPRLWEFAKGIMIPGYVPKFDTSPTEQEGQVRREIDRSARHPDAGSDKNDRAREKAKLERIREHEKEQNRLLDITSYRIARENQREKEAVEAKEKARLERIKAHEKEQNRLLDVTSYRIARENQAEAERIKKLEEFEEKHEEAYHKMMKEEHKWLIGGVKGLETFAKQSKITAATIDQSMTGALNSLSDNLTDFILTGKMNWRDMVNSMIRDILRLQVKAAMGQASDNTAKWLKTGIGLVGQFFSGSSGGVSSSSNFAGAGGQHLNAYATGKVFDGGRQLTKYAKGGVVDTPTIFPMANGAGLMGEAGPEAVMPLTEVGNELGVKAEKGREKTDITINVHNESGEPMKVNNQAAREDAQGMVIDLWLDGYNRNKRGMRSMLQGAN